MHILRNFITTFLVAGILSIGIGYIFAWTGPRGVPPNDNVAEPINVGGADQTKAAKINASDFCIASSGKCLSAAITGPIPPPGPISGVHYGYCVEVFSPFSTVGQCSPGRTGIDSIAPAICAFSGCECPAEYLKIRQAVTDTVGTVSQSLKSAIVCVKK